MAPEPVHRRADALPPGQSGGGEGNPPGVSTCACTGHLAHCPVPCRQYLLPTRALRCATQTCALHHIYMRDYPGVPTRTPPGRGPCLPARTAFPGAVPANWTPTRRSADARSGELFPRQPHVDIRHAPGALGLAMRGDTAASHHRKHCLAFDPTDGAFAIDSARSGFRVRSEALGEPHQSVN
jgi:hypothetical protein